MLRTIALLAALALLTSPVVQAQTLATIGGPAEQPPATYAGQMYVDSRGCVFLRAGFGGQVTWVPRVTAARAPLCGYPPSLGPAVRAEVQEAAPTIPAETATPAPATPEIRLQKPAAVSAAAPPQSSYVPAVPRAAVRQPATARGLARRQAAAVINAPRRIGCYASAPVAVRVALVSGGTVVLCTKGDGTMTGARAPIYPGGSAPGAAFGGREKLAAVPHHAPVRSAAIPDGYKPAWKDGRLNPQRGIGTAEGHAAQDRVWTRVVPAKAVKSKTAKGLQQPKANSHQVGRTGSPIPIAALYVQVGSFGQPSNATGTAARLAALGLPVARSTARAGRLQVVLAGPFIDAGAAHSALAMARRMGFGDAFVRR